MSGALEIKVIHEPSAAEPFVVLSKPAGLASAPLKSLDEDSAFSQCARLFPAAKSVCGKKAVEGGLLHRIDTATSGLLLVASSQEFYDHIIAAQDAGRFVKGYRAECDVNANNAQALGGFPPLGMQAQKAAVLCGLEISSYFRPFGKGGKVVRPVLQDSNVAALKKIGSKKIYSTKIVAADFLGEGAAKLECKIAQGYRHQVRCHLAWLGFPVRGDALYNAVGGPSGGPMRFEAVSLEFPDLFSEKIFRFTLD
jgi:23S rRNA pseudouridine1911/1915/1917 synthase